MNPFRRLRRFIDESVSELKKVTWPTTQQTWRLTVLVFVISGLVGAFIAVLDLAITWLIARLAAI